MKGISWTFILNTKNRDKAAKIVSEIESVLTNSTPLSSEIYWKDSTKFKIELCQPMSDLNFPEILITTLNQIRVFSNSWTMDLPPTFNAGSYNIAGVTKSGISIAGIDWISFSLDD